jgi:hypothetical protein
MPADPDNVLHRLAVADAATITQLIDELRYSEDPSVLVVVALFAPEPAAVLRRAAVLATTSRDRQAVAIAAAYLAGDPDQVGVLARDHLVDHPDSVLVAWIATAAQHLTPNPKDQS